jgi:hypothetical protein
MQIYDIANTAMLKVAVKAFATDYTQFILDGKNIILTGDDYMDAEVTLVKPFKGAANALASMGLVVI